MENLPLFFRLRKRPVLLVGAGAAAVAKARLLLAAGADVRVVAPQGLGEVADWAAQGRLRWERRAFDPADVAGMTLVIGAMGDDELDAAVADAAKEAAIPVNIVDRPELSSFIVPSIVDRSPVTIGISTNGSSPVLARRLREQIETLLPTNLGRLANFLNSFRSAVKAKVDSFDARRRLWEDIIDGPIARDVLAGRETDAREAMLSRINRRHAGEVAYGHVDIVGAGPGDPELLTVKALRALQDADLVVYDRLIGDEILDLVRRDAERIYVGKARSNHAVPQDQINELLVTHARAGRRVVRLKGGDPFVFGRGGEEVERLRAAGISTAVIPGITAATGCAASAGLPLTHRDHASAVTFVTGHGVDGEPDVDWSALSGPRHTLVVYMGVSRAGSLARQLIGHGRAPDTPIAIIENGTRPDERVIVGTLANVPSLVRTAQVGAPALIVIGEVAALADAARELVFSTSNIPNALAV
ncbi:MAG: uroporphyrinogen-III C-methyltransferase [Rhodospirillaceae bacterium]|jgi:uroporphyrin-III C-methyltransferase/precorrin-2 dehydrogenase/sirohydrochlorin ferrochelatase|nr:uroporphyrinogen-III C-methyltransferase [Rhodospirillaceae bacterium]MBT3931400.1 uroporphyrinogen-III C-methyltransferase [Rhodospirillaceae bacterium]MBT4772592.1 uroporphyrinogen-III C-methyltransferase [Rhodospirillaceae bacterium]MBT5357977.1 uroporphyrinogen-III C-methyltransferase [Rhodospirillaceae bacterium]MBT5768574.1 uroporphyrinogen-III C-methyltransferase [Rhodospirillaceae bacterium]